ncbi:TonB-dependent receptor [Sphingomonas sp.]|uniref:TonB-dependent receptor n=1 Tax=Sphingomonas sp. TaxID=28214 RepID=UPI000DB09B6D|nr:TonB-dependent receptor [Sphingomonas sp.]PZU10988.1 MAG: hypothetical protein DI605_05120 [Sphingomonas sp.]
MRHAKALLLSSALALVPGAVMAQDVAPVDKRSPKSAARSSAQQASSREADSGLEEIVVTAERREASVQRTAVAISVIGGAELAKAGIANPTALLDSLPGLDITRSNVNANLSLRGLGGGGSTQYADPVVAFNVGGVPLSRTFSPASAVYDVQRVELLKGPQGTLYGRNATVGALNVIPNQPSNHFEGGATAQFGNYSSKNFNGYLNAPLSDGFAARIAGTYNKHDGYLTNGYDDADNWGARLSLRGEVTPNLTVLAWADLYRDRSRGPGTIVRYPTPGQAYQFPNNPWFSYSPAGCGNPALCPTWGDSAGATFAAPFRSLSVVEDTGFVRINQDIYAGQVDWDIGFAKLTILPAHVDTAVDTRTFSGGLTYNLRNRTYQNSVETRLASNNDGPLKWLIGGIYFYEHINSRQDTFEPNGYQVLYSPNLTDESVGLFGQATYSITSRLRATGGIRYTSETKKQDGFTLLDGAFTATSCPSPGIFVTGSTTALGYLYPVGYCQVPNQGRLHFTNVSYKAGVEFDLARQSLLYANVSTGFKAGGFSPALPPNTYKPEKLTAYVIGSKNRFFDNKLQVNLELFYWDYKDQQISLLQALHPAGQSSYPVNVDGYVKGAELDVSVRPLSNSVISLDLLYERGKYDVYPTAISSVGTVGGLTDYPRVNLPRWSGTVKAEQGIPLKNGGRVVIGADTHFESGTWLRPVAEAARRPGEYRDPFATVNASLGWESSDAKLSVTLFVNNIGNKAVIGTGTGGGLVAPGTFYRPAGNPADARFATLQPPRTYGVRAGVKF